MPNDLRFPEQFGVKVLYKFRAYRTRKQKEWVRQILQDHKVYFSTAAQLNDKDDLRPRLRLRKLRDEAATRAMLLADAENAWAKQKPLLTDAQITRNRLMLSTMPIGEFEQRAIQKTHRRLGAEYWIFSLAANRDAVHLWDKYADRGRGLCIHFHADARSPFRFAQKVIYQRRRSTLLFPFQEMSNDEVGSISTRTKTLLWKDEDEYRYIRYPDTDYSNLGLGFAGQHAFFFPQAIAGLTLGPAMPMREASEITDLVRRYLPHITEVSHCVVSHAPRDVAS